MAEQLETMALGGGVAGVWNDNQLGQQMFEAYGGDLAVNMGLKNIPGARSV